MKSVIFYITHNGQAIAEKLKAEMPGCELCKFVPATVARQWDACSSLIFVMASGIVVRTIAPLLKDKKSDPAVVVLDEHGKFAISLVSGHLGGANILAKEIAKVLEGEAIITTASDVNNLTSLDIWARDSELIIENDEELPRVATQYLNNGELRVYSDIEIVFPDEFLKVNDPAAADAIITNRKRCCDVNGQIYMRPQNLVIGIGCNSGTSAAEIEAAIRQTLDEHNLAFASVASIATVTAKAEERGLKLFAEKNKFPMEIFSPEELNRVEGIGRSKVVFRATGAYAVAEPAAILAAGSEKLIVTKQKKNNVTVAIAERKIASKKLEAQPRKGVLYIVGTGPGRVEHMTPAAQDAIKKADVVVGYGRYLQLIRELLKGKEIVSTGMTQEVERCSKAVQLARDGETVAMVSGGDPGVYAMAGLVIEILRSKSTEDRKQTTDKKNFSSEIRVEVVPGISALNAAASRLGAPLMHDFACISLSDRLTPWELIAQRLDAAAAADFVIVLYNPRSKGRDRHINRAREIVLKHRKEDTPVGIVKGAMREQETIIVTTLENMEHMDIDMQSTVIIGNSTTFEWNNLMITPRGYEQKAELRKQKTEPQSKAILKSERARVES